MFPWAEFAIIAPTHLLAVASPGPDFALVLKNSLTQSKLAGLYTALGLGAGILVHVFYSLAGIGIIISQSILLFNVIKIAGALYLIWIGIQGLRSQKATPESEEYNSNHIKINKLKSFKKGFVTNLLNPKATLFFLSLFALVVDPATPLWVQIIYGVEMSIATVLWFSVLAVIFGGKKLRTKLFAIKHIIERAMGVVLIGLGIKVLTSK